MEEVSVAAVKVPDYGPDAVSRGVAEAVGLLGGLRRFVRPGERILLKPNLLEGVPPERAVTTHPEVVRAMIRQVKACGAAVVVGDSPGVSGTLKAAEKSGILRICREEDTEVVPFLHSREYLYPEGLTVKKFLLTDELSRADKVITLSKMKTHTFMGMTGATKILFGCVVGMQKAQFHLRMKKRREFAGMLVDLAGLVKPVLSVVDGIVGMEGNGPRNGRPFPAGLILAGTNCFAVDVVMAEMMGLPSESLPVVDLALKRELAPPLDKIRLVGNGSGVRHRFAAPHSMRSLEDRVPAWMARWARAGLTARPEIGPSCIGCGRCAAHCPPRAMQVRGGRVWIDDERCIRCYCCQELCPADAVRLREGALLKLLQGFPG